MPLYKDLVQFVPIEIVVELRKADAKAAAKGLVESFVISARMAEQLNTLVVPNLRFDKPADNKGLLIVGNYGTGKSHLMAVISAVAEHADLAKAATNDTVAENMAPIAGRFQVIRGEIGAVTHTLRDIVCGMLEDRLDRLGVSYQFPPDEKPGAGRKARSGNKEAFQELMLAFHARFPDQGLLLVLDELLDYLRTRKDQELVFDLNFLRELGEICKTTRFRFISGVQESLFDNPRFQFVADSLRRVRDRFEQVRIAREDVAYVVAERLLKKTAAQREAIRQHLQAFTPLYGSMNERMDEFVRLFPVHPDYLDTFERVYVAEKREVLKTISGAMQQLMKKQVPGSEPGLLAYDSYWPVLRDNPSLRSLPEVREVIDRSAVLEGRIDQAFTRPQYRPMAKRIVHALSVHRLTTADIYAPIGATAEELRDGLCLHLPSMPEHTAGFLKTIVETVLNEIVRTVSGQFISANRDNGQYYLDLKKITDFDSLIEKKAETLDTEVLDRYYFEALARVMECADQTHKPGFRIWEHEVEWRDRRAGRSGYLFFGAPNERSTAQPPRDFYVYFLQPYAPPPFKDEQRDDEVFFRLVRRDDELEQAVRLYASAREAAAGSSGTNKQVYEKKATERLRDLTAWLRRNMDTAFDVMHQGRVRKFAEVVRGKVPGGEPPSVRELVNLDASALLGAHFENQSPDYPTFSVLVTARNREQAAQEALRWIGGGIKSKQGAAILDALELLDGDQLKPHASRYAKGILDLLAARKPGQVVNRSDVIHDEHGIELWQPFRIEPEFLAVVLAALVHAGDIVLSLPGRKIDAASIDELVRQGITEVVAFKHLDRPRDLPLGALQELFGLLGIPRGLIVNPATRENAVTQLQVEIALRLEKIVAAQGALHAGLLFWGRPVLTPSEEAGWTSRLEGLKAFLESLQPFNSVGKLKNFSHDVEAVAAHRDGVRVSADVDRLRGLLTELGPGTSYLTTAEAVMPPDHPWVTGARRLRDALLAKLADPSERARDGLAREVERQLADAQRGFRQAYLALHLKARLANVDDRRKGELAKDSRLAALQQLRGVDMMPDGQLTQLENELFGMKTCVELAEGDLEKVPTCPHCSYRPIDEPVPAATPSARLDAIDRRLDALLGEWTRTLLANLADPTVSGNIDLLGDRAARKSIQDFMNRKTLPDPVGATFVKALHEILAGLEKVVLDRVALQAALENGGVPCTLDDMRRRFDRHLSDLSRGKDPARVRVVLDA
jgi:hypothetical protein